MKTFFVASILLALSVSVIAQETVDFLDEYHRPMPAAEDATYYRRTQLQDSLYHVRQYYVSNDQLEMEGTFMNETPPRKEQGKFIYYYENGKVKEEGSYTNGKKSGLWKGYYDNGQIADEEMHLKDKRLFYQHWDRSGNALLKNGTGKYTQYSSEAVAQHIEIFDSLLLSAFTIDAVSSDSIYLAAQQNAEYKGGMKVLYQAIGRELKYPKAARRAGVEGKVFIEFAVDKNGNVRDVKVLKGIGAGCDEEAANVLRTKHNWNPATVKGKAVIQKMILPIAFKLG